MSPASEKSMACGIKFVKLFTKLEEMHVAECSVLYCFDDVGMFLGSYD